MTQANSEARKKYWARMTQEERTARAKALAKKGAKEINLRRAPGPCAAYGGRTSRKAEAAQVKDCGIINTTAIINFSLEYIMATQTEKDAAIAAAQAALEAATALAVDEVVQAPEVPKEIDIINPNGTEVKEDVTPIV